MSIFSRRLSDNPPNLRRRENNQLNYEENNDWDSDDDDKDFDNDNGDGDGGDD